MKKLIASIFVSIALLFVSISPSYAAVIYSNDFTSSYTGFWTFFGECSTSTTGLNCTNNALSVYTTNFNNVKCVYGDITMPPEPYEHTQHLLLWEDTDESNLGKGALFYIPTTGTYSLANYPSSATSSGMAVPVNGTHTYGLCKDGDEYTTYIDGTEIQTETFTDLSPNQIGFQLTPGSTLTNFYATDTLPVSRLMTSVDPAQVWVKKNLLNLGVKFDLKAEVYRDSTLVTSGQVNSVNPGVNPTQFSIPFNSFSPVNFATGSALKIAIYARNACTGSLLNSGTATLSYNAATTDSRFGATIDSTSATYHLLNGFLLGTTVGSSQQNISVNAGTRCSAFKSFGTWTITP